MEGSGAGQALFSVFGIAIFGLVVLAVRIYFYAASAPAG
jgi:hypothetical protein